MPVSRHSAFLRRLAWLGAAHGPFWFSRYSPPLIGLGAAVLSKDARRHVRENLHRIRGPAPMWRDAVETVHTFMSFAGALTESLAAGSKNDRPLEPTIEGQEHIHSLVGHPFIIGTIHAGGWDVIGSLLTDDLELDVVVVMAHEADVAAERFHDAIRGVRKVRIVHVGQDPLDALPLVHQLRGAGVVAMQLDRTRPGMRTVPVRLFGAEAALPEGPLHLARLTGAPILPVFCARLGFRRYRVVIHPPVRLERRASPSAVRATAQSIADAITAFLADHPSQWFNF